MQLHMPLPQWPHRLQPIWPKAKSVKWTWTPKKITIKHGEIKNLDMPGMTMVFQVKDPALLEAVKAGDKVRFKAEKSGGAIVVTDIQPAK